MGRPRLRAESAEFLTQKLHRSWLGVQQAFILTANILLRASENVDGCGGDPQIAVFPNNGASGTVFSAKLYEITKMIDRGEWNAGHILHDVQAMEIRGQPE